MRKAASVLKANGIRFQIKTIHQIKVGKLNFYPTRGTIFRDGDAGALKHNGLEAFLKIASSKEAEEAVADDQLLERPANERTSVKADSEQDS